jgi:hypothetical protein
MFMRSLAISAITLGLAASANAGFNTSTFEDLGLNAANSYYNAAPNLTNPTYSTSGSFVSGGNSLTNSYTYYPQYSVGSWSGWSISNQTNTTYVNQTSTPDYSFEYTSVTGSGANTPGTNTPSATYAVANTEGNGTKPVSVINLAPGSSPESVQITNTAYDYDAMKYGDGFATPFTTGNYLSLTIYGYTGMNGTGTEVGSPIVFYLGDYRELNGASDFLLTTWQTLDLSSLVGAQSLVFGTDSNDNDAYGEALPYEFALDNLTTFTPSSVPEPSSLVLCLSGIGIGSLVFRRVRRRKGLL